MWRWLRILAFGSVLLSAACTSSPNAVRPLTNAPTQPAFSATLTPDLFIQSAMAETQLAQVQAQNTALAAHLTATPLAATQAQQSTQDTLHLTQVAFERQLTADAATSSANYTQAAATGTAAAQGTATTVAETQAVFATGTAESRTATPLAATEAAIVAQTEQAQATASWQKFWSGFWAALGPTLVVLFLLALGYAFIKVLPVLKMRLGIVHDPATGRTLLLLDPSAPANVVDPARSLGPALLSRGQTVNLAGNTNIAVQAQVTAQTQAVDLARALPQTARPVALPVSPLPTTPASLPAGDEAVEGQIRIIPSETVQPWLDEMRHKLLSDGESP